MATGRWRASCRVLVRDGGAHQHRASDEGRHVCDRVLRDAHCIRCDGHHVGVEAVMKAMRPVHSLRVHPSVGRVVPHSMPCKDAKDHHDAPHSRERRRHPARRHELICEGAKEAVVEHIRGDALRVQNCARLVAADAAHLANRCKLKHLTAPEGLQEGNLQRGASGGTPGVPWTGPSLRIRC